MIEDDALERLLAQAQNDDPQEHKPMPDAEHRRLFGWSWDDPAGDLDILWPPGVA